MGRRQVKEEIISMIRSITILNFILFFLLLYTNTSLASESNKGVCKKLKMKINTEKSNRNALTKRLYKTDKALKRAKREKAIKAIKALKSKYGVYLNLYQKSSRKYEAYKKEAKANKCKQ